MRNFSGVFKNKPAQQMVEFLLIMPFIIILFGILTEYAYALTINLNLNQGLKVVTSSIYRQINPGIDKDNVKTMVKYWLKNYLRSRYAPANEENELNVDYAIVGENAVFIASYKYIPAFTLPNIYFHFLPTSMRFSAIAAIPKVLMGPNYYDININPQLWDAPSVESSKRGIMNEMASASNVKTNSILFLLPKPVPIFPGAKTYEVRKWNGDAYDVTQPFVIANLTNKRLYNCTADLMMCAIDSTNFMNTFLVAGKTNIFFYDDYSSFLNWASPDSIAIKTNSVTGNLKNALALVENSSLNTLGNYDKLDISAYNSLFNGWNNNKYFANYYGSLVIIHTGNETASELNNLLSGVSVPNNIFSDSAFDMDFGTRVGP